MSKDSEENLESAHQLGHKIWKGSFDENTTEKWGGEWKKFKNIHLPKNFDKENKNISPYYGKGNWKAAVTKWIDYDLVKEMIVKIVSKLLSDHTVDDFESLEQEIRKEYKNEIFDDLKSALITKASKKSFSRIFSIKKNSAIYDEIFFIFKQIYYHPKLSPELTLLNEIDPKNAELKLNQNKLKPIEKYLNYIAIKQNLGLISPFIK